MKRLFLGLIIGLLSVAAVGCSTGKTAEQKAYEKAVKAQMDSVAGLEARRAVANNHFVILPDRMMLGNRGLTINAPEQNTNFIFVTGSRGVVQIAFNNGRPGLNGLGGVTVEGKVTNYKVKNDDKDGNTYITYNLFGTSVNAQVSITVYKNSNQVIAMVSPNFFSQRLTVYGTLIPYDPNNELPQFEGRSL